MQTNFGQGLIDNWYFVDKLGIVGVGLRVRDFFKQPNSYKVHVQSYYHKWKHHCYVKIYYWNVE